MTARFVVLAPIVLLLGLLLGSCVSNRVDHVVSEGIAVVAKEKSSCEQWASVLKQHRRADGQEYITGVGLYIDGKAAFDGWIEQLKFDLTANRNIEESDRYKKSLIDAARKCEAFIEFVTKVSGKAPHRGLETAIIGALINGGIQIWKEYRVAAKERREEILKLLDGLKWKSLDEIK